jgi:hypothetical protein
LGRNFDDDLAAARAWWQQIATQIEEYNEAIAEWTRRKNQAVREWDENNPRPTNPSIGVSFSLDA